MGLLEDEYLRSQRLKATPRDQILGLLSDFIAKSYSPERTQQMQGVSKFMGAPAISETLDRLSYGQPLTTGAGGLGGTTRIRPEALEAAMTVAPMVGPASRAAGAGAMAAGRAGERFAERAVPRVMERGGMGAEMLQGMSRGTVSPLDVYHGSPHKFDRFDASKIGTGEGAQAYGHGIYTAEAPATAIEYQKKLSSTGSAKNLANQYGGVDKGLAEAKRRVESYKQLIADGGGGAMSRAKSMLQISEKNVQDLEAVKAGLPENTGNLYKVDLPDEQIAKMLDWDKPLSEQQNILSALTPESMGLTLRQSSDGGFMAYVGSNGKPIGMQMKGATPEKFRENWINRLKEMGDLEGGAGRAVGYLGGTSNSGNLAPSVSEALRQAGIPGIKYLDEGSRNLANTWIVRHPQGGENVFSSKASAEAYLKRNPEETLIEPKVTRNFVTFPGEEQNLTILERNGQPMVARTQQQDAAPDLLQYQQMLDEDERKKLGGLLFR